MHRGISQGAPYTHFRQGNVNICLSKSACLWGEPTYFSRLVGVRQSVGCRVVVLPLCHSEEVGNVVLSSSDGYHTCMETSRGTADVAEPVEAEQPQASNRVAPCPWSKGQRLIASVSF